MHFIATAIVALITGSGWAVALMLLHENKALQGENKRLFGQIESLVDVSRRLKSQNEELRELVRETAKEADKAIFKQWVAENVIKKPDWKKPVAITKGEGLRFVRQKLEEGNVGKNQKDRG